MGANFPSKESKTISFPMNAQRVSMRSLNTYESPNLINYLYKRYADTMIRVMREAISDALDIPLGIANTIASLGIFTLSQYNTEVWRTQMLLSEHPGKSGLLRDSWSNNSFAIHIGDGTETTVQIELVIYNSAIIGLQCVDMPKIAVPIDDYTAYNDINKLIDLFQWNFTNRQKPKKLFCYEYIGRLLIAAFTDKARHLLKMHCFSYDP